MRRSRLPGLGARKTLEKVGARFDIHGVFFFSEFYTYHEQAAHRLRPGSLTRALILGFLWLMSVLSLDVVRLRIPMPLPIWRRHLTNASILHSC